MPELPEVETVRRGLHALLAGHTLREVQVFERQLRFPVPRTFVATLTGARVDAVERRAKYLLIQLGAHTVLSHLGMTGTWQHRRVDAPKEPHDRLRLLLDDGSALVYNDPRKFGFVDVLVAARAALHPRLRALGPEPLDAAAFSAAYLQRVLAGRKAAVKTLIMDQQIVVGVGNIYAAEALFRAGISPKTRAQRLREPRLELLVKQIRAVLEEAIALGGSSIDDFKRTNGESGYFQNTFRVYGRAGLPCVVCKEPLRQARIGGRGTVYCARCQR